MSEQPENLRNGDNEPEPVFEVDQKDFSKHWQYLKKRESLAKGIVGGIGAAVGTLLLWILLVHFTGYKIGWMALLEAVAIGFSVQYLGKAVSPSFGIIGATISLISWLIGNFMTAAVSHSHKKSIGLLAVLCQMDFHKVLYFFKGGIGAVDWVIGFTATFIAFYFGYKTVTPPQ
jgi:hypothetical protein